MAFGLLLLADSFAQAKEWSRFRGPNGTGISLAKGIPSKFTLDDANWRVALKGDGHSSPVLWGGRVFVTGSDRMEGEFIVQCLNTADGSEAWTVSFPQKSFRTHRFNHLSSSTPATNGEQLVLVVSKPGAHTLVALDLDGKLLWDRTLDTIVSGHGGGISPILFEGKVILAGDEDNQSFIAAMDADTGKVLWKVDRINAKAAFSTPCVFTDPSGTKGLVFNSMGHGITFVDPSTGETLWEQAGIFDKRSVSSTLVAEGLLIGTCGSGGGGNYLVAVKPGGAAKGTPPSIAYKLRRSIPYVPTSVAKEGLLFLWGDSGVVTCVQAKTGELNWQERVEGRFFGSPVWVEGRLFCISTAGKMVVIAASDSFKSIAVNDLGEPSNATPALDENQMYVRTLGHLISLGDVAR
ncbi:MAG: PQQ-binding-like beta-propeller repeat protein [Verrucomicrobiota bacterium]|nr:PQQ-binding-like beta-propeller repeat protein [Verrucomicrobiota bacterium]